MRVGPRPFVCLTATKLHRDAHIPFFLSANSRGTLRRTSLSLAFSFPRSFASPQRMPLLRSNSAAVFAFAVVAALLATADAQSQPSVNTPFGAVAGGVTPGTNVFFFKGIPYARPPTGTRRFMPPQLVTPWAPQVRNATEFGAGCMAQCLTKAFPDPPLMCPKTVSEDCLSLNIWTPTLNATAGLPVIVFIHGGNYIGGASGVPLYDGTDFVKNQNVVFVTLNYRLGIFGALYTGTVLGNYQTQDQRMALTWIAAAIASFGGNPKLVTVTGQSAGAASVAAHLASPLSWGLFQRAIIVSDPFTIRCQTPESAMQLGAKFLKIVGCPEQGGQDEIECLQALSADAILNATMSDDLAPKPGHLLSLVMQWTPIVDGTQLPYQPMHALLSGHSAPGVPVMVGNVANESVQFIYDLFGSSVDALGYDLFIDFLFAFNSTTTGMIGQMYGPPPPSGDTRMFMGPLATDWVFYCATRFLASALTKSVPTFVYLFDYVREGLYAPIFHKYMPYCDDVACHAVDLAFVFNSAQFVPKNIPVPHMLRNETHLAHVIQTAWANFALTGNPNGGHGLPDGLVWPQYDGDAKRVLNYSIPSGVITAYRSDFCDQWDRVGYTSAEN